MILQSAFCLSFYVTLGLACSCLASAELFFFDWMGIFLMMTLAIILLAYAAEGRWSINQAAANIVALLIAVGAAGWIIFNLPRTEEDLIRGGVPWPAGLLPHVGPLLALLLLLRLFR